MATKIYDIAVEIGHYTDNSGKDKKRWKNIGAVWNTKDRQGNSFKFLTLDRSFNLAAVPCKEGANSVIASLFKPQNNANDNTTGYQEQNQQRQDFSSNTTGNFANVEDLPF